MRAELMEEPSLSAVCPWCGSAEPPFAGGFCPGCHQSREAVDRAWYCEEHRGRGDLATLVLAPPSPTLVAHGRLCPVCGSALDPMPTVVAAPSRRRRRWRARTLEVALGTATVFGLLLYGTDRTGDFVSPPGSPAVSKAATLTPRAAISQAYGYDVGPCVMVYQTDSGNTYVCGEGDIATIRPDGTVRLPSLWP